MSFPIQHIRSGKGGLDRRVSALLRVDEASPSSRGECAQSAPKHRLVPIASILACAFACVLIALGVLVPASPAYASYKDVTDEYPAAQDLGAISEPIYASEIPDGTYSVIARTSSRMCIMYENNGDAASNVNKERCFVQVSGGQMIAAFYISKAYTRLYMGTAEEAASMTDATGTDDLAYLVGEPADGYVPHRFVIAIPAMNVPMTIATFAGGNYELSSPNAKWFTRQVVFIPGSDMLRAIEEARSGGQEPVQPEQAEPEPTQPEPAADGGQQAQGQSGQSAAAQGGANGAAAANNQQANQGTAQNENANTGAEGDGQTQPRRGILLSPTNLADRPMGDSGTEGEDETEEVQTPLPPEVLVGGGLFALAAAGAGARVLTFRRGLRRPVG